MFSEGNLGIKVARDLYKLNETMSSPSVSLESKFLSPIILLPKFLFPMLLLSVSKNCLLTSSFAPFGCSGHGGTLGVTEEKRRRTFTAVL